MYVGATSSRTINDGGEVSGNMEETKAKARAGPAAMPVAQQQQLLFLQQLHRQKQQQESIMSRFPSNIDAHLRPQQHLRSQSPISNNPNPNPNPQLSSSTPSLNVSNAVNTNFITNSSAATADNSNNNSALSNAQQKVSRANQVELQMSYQDAWRVCHPDFKRPFSSLEDACERLLPYHVVADYEAEEDDKILDSDTNGQILSRSQQWDHNIAAKVAEFTATFEKQVLAFNIISHKRDLGEFRTEEKLMIEQLLLQEERRVLLAIRQEMEARQKAGNLRMASSISHAERIHAESQAQAELMGRVPLRPGAVGSQGSNMAVGNDMSEQENPDEMMNGWGDNNERRGDEKEPSDDFLNDEETEAEDGGMQSGWHGGGDLDLN